jgi:hypothetical protein
LEKSVYIKLTASIILNNEILKIFTLKHIGGIFHFWLTIGYCNHGKKKGDTEKRNKERLLYLATGHLKRYLRQNEIKWAGPIPI